MFGLFKKKKEAPAQEAAAEQSREQSLSQEIKTFAADFLPEETDILAVTGPSSMSHDRVGESGSFLVTIGLTAWKDEYTQELRQEPARLQAVVDRKLLEHLSARAPRNFLISVTVRPSEDGSRFLMVDLPKPAFDPELKAILEEQKAPVTLEVEGLGTFTLNRSLGWFEAAVDWMGAEVSLTVDQAEETLPAAQDTARALMEDRENWDARIRAFVAEQLLDRANELLAQCEDGDEGAEPYTAESFLACLEPESILSGPNGAFEVWFGGDDLFLEHPVHVSGNLEQGPLLAEFDG